MAAILERFWSDEAGNTTVDWLVLTAGIVMLGAAVTASISSGTTEFADDSAQVVEERGIGI